MSDRAVLLLYIFSGGGLAFTAGLIVSQSFDEVTRTKLGLITVGIALLSLIFLSKKYLKIMDKLK